MRTPHWLGMIILALVVGGALGYLLAPTASVERERSLPQAAENAKPVPPDKPSHKPPANGEPTTLEGSNDVRKPPVATGEAGPDPEVLKAALRTIPPYPRRTGDGTITGTITDGAGNPIAGVRVTAQAMRGNGNDYMIRVWDYGQRELWDGLAEDVTKLVRLRSYHFNEAFTSTTNGDGFYRIGGLSRENTYLTASLDGYRFEALNGQTYHRPDAVVDWVGHRAYPVLVKVVQPDGGEPPAGRVEVIDLSTYGPVPVASYSEGREWSFGLNPGVYSFRVNYHSLQTATESRIVSIRPSESVQEVELKYNLGDALVVNIDRALLGYQALAVHCGPDDLPREAEAVLDSLHPPERKTQNVYSDMPATFTGLVPGRYVVGVQLSGRWIGTMRIDYAGGRFETELRIESPPERECITCKVTTPGRRTLLNPKFSIKPEGGESFGLIAWPAGNQTYLLQLPPPNDLDRRQPGVLHLADQRFGTTQLALNSLDTQTVELVVQPTGFLVVTWDESRFLNSEKPLVRLLSLTGELVREERWWHTNSLPNGLVLTKLQPGMYTMEILIDTRAKIPLHSGAIEIAEGFNEAAPELAATHDVLVQTSNEEIWYFELVWTINGEERKERIHLQQDRTASLKIPTGQYVVRYRVRTEREVREVHVSVPGTDTVVLD